MALWIKRVAVDLHDLAFNALHLNASVVAGSDRIALSEPGWLRI